ncbi:MULTISPECIES: ParB N-terminal domain-containing protein [unclassified Streptomyces]|uniref:ParB/RepB/Spo0J family partition protein n=1 Tax=unclassified Streptomyces TaxID=2593676 RepID=UPI00339ECF41
MTVTSAERPDTEQHDDRALQGYFEWVNPLDFDPDGKTGSLIVDPFNHRRKPQDETEEDTTEPDAETIQSVEEMGVQQAIVLRPLNGDHQGKYGIIIGQRRTKAAWYAAQKDLAEGRKPRPIPALIRPDLTDADDEALAASFVENKIRRNATLRDDVRAVQQLSLMVGSKKVPKAKAERLAAAMGISVEELDAAQKVAAMDAKTLDRLDQAGTEFDFVELAEYDEVREVNGAERELREAKRRDQDKGNASRGAWKQALAKLRKEKEQDEQKAAFLADCKARKIRVLTHTWDLPRGRKLSDLRDGENKTLTPETHERCPAHAVHVGWGGEIEYWCTSWKKSGHQLTDKAQATARGADKLTAEQEKAEAKRVRENNQAFRTARTVRREHIRDMCASKGEPSTEVKMMITEIMMLGDGRFQHFLGSKDHHELLAFFLADDKLKSSRGREQVKAAITALVTRNKTAKRIWWLYFAQVAGMFESEHMGDSAWRGKIAAETVQWLRFLDQRGYELIPLEEEIISTFEQQQEAERQKAEERERERLEKAAQQESGADAEAGEDTEPDADEESGADAEAGEDTEPDAK